MSPEEPADSESSGPAQALSSKRPSRASDGEPLFRRRIGGRSEVGELRNELERTKGELELLSRPLNDNDVLSAAVNAVVAEGESLVTGGYQLADGRYELTFITPTGVDRNGESPGTDFIMIETRSLVVDDAFVESSGLETLATNVRNTLQHAEAWTGDDVFETFKSASEFEGVDMSSVPRVVANPREPFKVEIRDPDGSGFQLNGEADFLADGSFAVKARAERKE